MNYCEKLSTDEESYSIKMLLKTQTPQKEAASLVGYSLSIDTYITNTEKEGKLRKTGVFF